MKCGRSVWAKLVRDTSFGHKEYMTCATLSMKHVSLATVVRFTCTFIHNNSVVVFASAKRLTYILYITECLAVKMF